MAIDRAGLATFLRHRREALQPEDIGLPRGPRRRTSGLRREEVAARCTMSADYYARLEQERGPHPSEQMIAAIAQGLHLSLDERDHLFRLAGHTPPDRGGISDHVSPGLARIFDRLHDTPAEVVTELGETLRQTPLGVALTGDSTACTGPERSLGFRWFSDPASRALYEPADHEFLGRMFASGLRDAVPVPAPRTTPTSCWLPATSSGPSGTGRRSACARTRSSGTSTRASARSNCTARRCSTPTSTTSCSSTRPRRAARATRSSGCCRSSALR